MPSPLLLSEESSPPWENESESLPDPPDPPDPEEPPEPEPLALLLLPGSLPEPPLTSGTVPDLSVLLDVGDSVLVLAEIFMFKPVAPKEARTVSLSVISTVSLVAAMSV